VEQGGKALTMATVSRLTRMTCPTRQTMPLRLSVLTWYWSVIHSRAERFPSR
jgi:hypothetical protein